MTSLPPAVVLVYLLANLTAFLLFCRDKWSAERGGWRMPERVLIAVAGIGPLGAVAAMQIFRHKTQKTKFRLVPLFLCLHVALVLIYVAGL